MVVVRRVLRLAGRRELPRVWLLAFGLCRTRCADNRVVLLVCRVVLLWRCMLYVVNVFLIDVRCLLLLLSRIILVMILTFRLTSLNFGKFTRKVRMKFLFTRLVTIVLLGRLTGCTLKAGRPACRVMLINLMNVRWRRLLIVIVLRKLMIVLAMWWVMWRRLWRLSGPACSHVKKIRRCALAVMNLLRRRYCRIKMKMLSAPSIKLLLVRKR